VPVVLVRGEIDKAFPIKLAHRLAALTPDCRVETVHACEGQNSRPDPPEISSEPGRGGD
jgi:hypothetical protein